MYFLIYIFIYSQAYHGHHQALEVLVQSLLDLDVRNSSGRTPLDLAAFKGHVECVDVLINQGASILVKDYILKRTPIHAAGMSKTMNDFIYHFPSNALLFQFLVYYTPGSCFNNFDFNNSNDSTLRGKPTARL